MKSLLAYLRTRKQLIMLESNLEEKETYKYFEQDGRVWKVSDDLRRRIEFRNVNLVRNWPALPTMDIVFLRNVLIYFDVPTKKSILSKLRKILKPDGYLFLGTAETTINLDPDFEQVHIDRTVCYAIRS